MGNTEEESQKVEVKLSAKEVQWNEKLVRMTHSINIALVPDPNGIIKMTFPTIRNPETHKQEWMDLKFRAQEIPPDEVLHFMGSPVVDFNTTHSGTVDINGKRHIAVFDRTYVHGVKTYTQCAWVPDKIMRAGLLFEKKINQRTRMPVAVLRKISTDPNESTPKYQIVGGKEADYRDLKRVFERAFIRRGGPVSDDDELDRFMHAAIEPIAQEVEK